MPLPDAQHPSSNAFARARDNRICWLLDSHPVTAGMLVGVGLFPNKAKALKRLNLLVKRRRTWLVGTVSRKAGRPEHVFARCRPKPDQLLHEVELSELCFKLDVGRIHRGSQVTDPVILPDAEVWINGDLYRLELDRGTMNLAQIARRFRKYEGSRELVLWVCATEARREALRRQAERLRSIVLFTTLAEALASPHGPIWRDFQGETAPLPRQRREGE